MDRLKVMEIFDGYLSEFVDNLNKRGWYDAMRNLNPNTHKEALMEDALHICDMLNKNGMKFSLMQKDGWGLVYCLNVKGKQVYSNSFTERKSKFELFYFSDVALSKRTYRLRLN